MSNSFYNQAMEIKVKKEELLPLLLAAVLVSLVLFSQVIAQTNVPTQVTVGNSAPVVSNVHVSGDNNITLIANATTSIAVTGTVQDQNGCSDITSGTSSIMLYRSGIGSSSCSGTTDDRFCYRSSAFTITSTCSGGTTLNTTTTFNLYYFAQPTDASSSFSGEQWTATIYTTDSAGSTSSADASPRVELLTLTAVSTTAASINYGTVGAGSNTGSVNQNPTTTNAGNSTTTLQLRALQTLVSGANFVPTTSQHYSSSTFTMPTGGISLQDTFSLVSGFFIEPTTSTSNQTRKPVYWGLDLAGVTATGTYTGSTAFSAVWAP